jgi:hypothetical protein
MGGVKLQNGTTGKRNIIVNSNSKNADMCELATNFCGMGFNSIIFNMYGIRVFIPEKEPKRYSTRSRRFNQLLYEVYMSNNMSVRPTIIMGNRKVNRGMTFHYAPPDSSDGLIWTDIILGKIDDKSTAVQKAGRGAGKIAHCPQYPDNIYYWTTEKTASMILTHNRRVDHVNGIVYDCTIQEALTIATNAIGRQSPIFEVVFFPCTPETFHEVKVEFEQYTSHRFNSPFREDKKSEDGEYMGYLREYKVYQFSEIRETPGWGLSGEGGSDRCTVCYNNGVLGVALRYKNDRNSDEDNTTNSEE